MLSAVVNAILENNDVADLYFDTVTTQDPENVVAWTLYGRLIERVNAFSPQLSRAGVFQKHIGNEINAQITLGQAEKLQRAILKSEEEQAAALAQQSAPLTDEKREEEEKDRVAGENRTRTHSQISSCSTDSRRRGIEECRSTTERRGEESRQSQQQVQQANQERCWSVCSLTFDSLSN